MSLAAEPRMVIVSVPFVQPVKLTPPMSVMWSSSVVTMSWSMPTEPDTVAISPESKLSPANVAVELPLTKSSASTSMIVATAKSFAPALSKLDRIGAGTAIDRLAGIDLAARSGSGRCRLRRRRSACRRRRLPS